MAPRSQEPQDIANPVSKDFIGKVSFNITLSKDVEISYVVTANNEPEAKDMVERLFYSNFPFDALEYTISISEVTDSKQQTTKKEEIKNILEMYVNNLGLKNHDLKIKYKGNFVNLSQVKTDLGLVEHKKVGRPELKIDENLWNKEVPRYLNGEQTAVETYQKLKIGKTSFYAELKARGIEKPIDKVDIVKEQKNENSWFCEYNIKIGTDRYRKGTKIEKVDNEIDARKQLDIYIKKNFSKVRSVTKVEIRKWNGEQDYSEEIVEKINKVVAAPIIPEKTKTLDEIIKENFSEEILNKPTLIIAISTTKVRQKDYESDFLVYPDNGESDDELFADLKKDFLHIKRKNVGIKRVKFKNVLETGKYKKILMGNKFQQAINNGKVGMEALAISLGMNEDIDLELLKEKLKEKKNMVDDINSFSDFLKKVVG